MKLAGHAIRLGDGIGATDIVSAQYDQQGMSRQWEECARHLLEDVDPAILPAIRRGDMVIAGQNFGRGHAHYYMTAVMACKTAGLSALIADQVNVLFQRAAIDQGLLVWQIKGIHDFVTNGDGLEIDFAKGSAVRTAADGTRETLLFKPLAPLIVDIVTAGGSNDWALARVGAVPAVSA